MVECLETVPLAGWKIKAWLALVPDSRECGIYTIVKLGMMSILPMSGEKRILEKVSSMPHHGFSVDDDVKLLPVKSQKCIYATVYL